MAKGYDSNDLKILSELRKDCNLTVRQISKKLDMHPNTILKRIKRLENNEVIIKNLSEIDFYKLGYDLRALIQIKVKMSSDWEEPIKEIASIPQMVSLYAVTGVPDFFGIVQVKGKEGLESVIRKIQKTNVVTKTTTHLMISCYKHPFEYNPLMD